MGFWAQINIDVTEGPESTWETQIFGFGYKDFLLTVGPKPGEIFYHIAGSNLLNNISGGHHTITWGMGVQSRCFANNTNPKLDVKGNDWRSWNDYDNRNELAFSTAPDGQLPDIETAALSCSEPSRNTSKAVQISEVRRTSDWERLDYDHWKNNYPETAWDRKGFFDNFGGKWCLVMDTDVASHKCPYKDFSKELAANVSEVMLGMMSCDEGEWQTIRAPCSDASHMSTLGSLGWGATLLSLAWWI